MPRRNFILAVLVLSIFFSFIADALQAQETKQFRIDSYRLDRFEDFLWLVNGGFDFSGYHRTGSVSDPPFDGWPRGEDRSQHSSQHRGAFDTQSRYRYRDLRQYLNGTLSAAGGFSRTSSFDSSAGTRGDVRSLSSSSYGYRRKASEFHVSTSLDLEVGRYFISDFFASFSGRAATHYSGYPGSDSHDASTGSRLHLDDSTYSQYRATDDGSAGGDDKNYDLTGELSIGWGRVYEGRSAATAIYVVNELRKRGMIEQGPSFDQMAALTDTIYQLRTVHALDSRLRRIDALTDIVAILQHYGVVGDFRPQDYFIVSDIWDYYPKDLRLFGWRLAAGAGIHYFRQSSQGYDEGTKRNFAIQYSYTTPNLVDTSDSKSTYYRYNHSTMEIREPFVSASLAYYQPLSLRWQAELNGAARLYFGEFNIATGDSWSNSLRNSEHGFREQDPKNHYDIATGGRLNCLIDSRTSLIASTSYTRTSLKIEAYSLTNLDGYIYHSSSSSRTTSWWTTSLDFVYRISIPTTLTVRGSAQQDRPSQESAGTKTGSNNWYYALSLRLTHYVY